MCNNEELIVGYLYEELSADERQAVESHLAACAACRLEVEELQSTRQHLTLWSPPVPDLGFRLIRGGAAPAPALPRRSRLVPAFAFAAAAVIVLAVAAAIANVEVRYGSDGMMVRTGWARGEQGPQQTPVPAAVPAASSGDFAALDRRLREIETALESQPAPSTQTVAFSRMSDAEMLRRVRQIVSEAEARQDTAVAQRLVGVIRDFNMQRRADLASIQQGLGQYQGQTNAEIAQSREMLNQFIRASARQEK